MKRFIFAGVLAIAAVSAQAAQVVKAEVNGMVCAFCAQGIEKKVRALPQTGDVYVNLKKGLVAIELKAGQTLAHEKVRELIKDAGYDVSKIETVASGGVKEIRSQIKE